MREFDGFDLYHINDMLTMRNGWSATPFATGLTSGAPRVEAWAWDCLFPRELANELGDLDLLGAPYSDFDLPGSVL